MSDNITESHPHLRRDLSIDQRLALKTAATRLQKDFESMFGTETIELFLHTSYEQFATRQRAQLFAAARRALRPPTPARPGQGRGQGQ